MYTAPNTDTMQGRQLQGLLDSTNRRARMLLAVDITTADGRPAYHQVLRAKAWTAKDGARMLTLDLDDGDWEAGRYATKVAHVNTATGKYSPARGMRDNRLLVAAQYALLWAFRGGVLPKTAKGSTVQVQAAQLCGCCGQQLTHPVSLTLGIGPECAKKLGLEHHYGGSKVLATAQATKAAPAAPAKRDDPAWAQDDLTQEERSAYRQYVSDGLADSDGYFGPLTPQNWVHSYRARKAAEAAKAAPAPASATEAPQHTDLGSVLGQLAAGSSLNATVDRDDVDILGVPYSEEERLARAALRQAENDMRRTARERDHAMRRGDWDRAQQLDDQYDTYRGMAGKYRAELVFAGAQV